MQLPARSTSSDREDSPSLPTVTSVSAQAPTDKMSTSLSQAGRSTRIAPHYPHPTGRDENTSKSTIPPTNIHLSNIWPTSYAQNPDTTHTVIDPAGHSRRRVSPTDNTYTERTTAADPVPASLASGLPRGADQPRNRNNWLLEELEKVRPRGAVQHPGRGYVPRKNVSHTTSLLDDGQENRVPRAGLNGGHEIDSSRRQDSISTGLGNLSHDMDPSRRQDNLPTGYGGLSHGPSQDPSLAPTTGANGSPAMQERFAFPGGHHTPNNSISTSRTGLSTAPSYTPSATNSGLPTGPFDSTTWRGQHYDASSNLPELAALSLDDRPASSAAPGLNAAPQTLNAGNAAQGWPNNGQSRYLNGFATLNGHAAIPQAASTSQYMTPNRSSVPAHSSPTFSSRGAQYTPPQDSRNQRPSSREVLVQTQANGQTATLYADRAGNFNQAAAHDWYTQYQLASELANGGSHANLFASGAQHNFRNPGYPLAANPYLAGASSLAFQATQNQDPVAGMRSPKLEEFRNQKHSKWEFKDVFGYLAEFSGDNLGSRLIQGLLDSANPEERDRVFSELTRNSTQLMKDIYGNYVIQKLFEIGTQVQKKALAAQMKPKFHELSMHIYGCRVVQKALDHVLFDQQLDLVHVLKPYLLQLMQNPNANHVVQKILDVLDREFLDFVMDTMRGQIAQLSSQRYGCRVVQKMLDKGSDKDRKDIFDEFYVAASLLVAHEFGNYVAQALLEKAAAKDRASLITFLTPMAVSLSKQQAASNVVEKCIVFGTPAQVRTLHQEFVKPGPDGRPQLVGMILNPYANYTIQRLHERFGASNKAGTAKRGVTPDQSVTSDQSLTPEQEGFRADVEAAMKTLNKEELGAKSLTSVADVLNLSVPKTPETPASAPVGTGWGGQQIPPTK